MVYCTPSLRPSERVDQGIAPCRGARRAQARKRACETGREHGPLRAAVARGEARDAISLESALPRDRSRVSSSARCSVVSISRVDGMRHHMLYKS